MWLQAKSTTVHWSTKQRPEFASQFFQRAMKFYTFLLQNASRAKVISISIRTKMVFLFLESSRNSWNFSHAAGINSWQFFKKSRKPSKPLLVTLEGLLFSFHYRNCMRI